MVDHISSDIRLASLSSAEDAIQTALSHATLPNIREAACLVPLTYALDSVLVTLFYQILKELRLVVLKLYSDIVDAHLILNYECIDII